MSLTCTIYPRSAFLNHSGFSRSLYGLLLIVCSLVYKPTAAQVKEVPASPVTEAQVENMTAANNDEETEDDSYMQLLQQYLKNPVNINTAGEEELQSLLMLSPLQIQNIIAYRNLFGKFISIYELQAVPLLDVGTIRKMQPFVTVSISITPFESIKRRLKNGDNSLLIRATQTLERAKGYGKPSDPNNNYYYGSPQKILLRYKYNYKHVLQYGIVAEKDAGEQFFKGAQKQGFDYYSAHFFARDLGIIKTLAIGDFTVNMGQGLIQWQSLAFKKGPDVTNIKRQSTILQPYNSAGEINFHRGIGITLSKKHWQATGFLSYKKIDGNLVTDTAANSDEAFISSLQTSGYHRTQSEIADKGSQRQLAFGGNLSYSNKNYHIGINAIHYKFKLPVIKSNDPYNLYALNGNSFGNYSVDYSYTFKNLHFFGETAISNTFDKAFVNGLLISAAGNVDISFVYRNIAKSYQSLYSNAFTESTYPTNEKGFFTGISIRPNTAWHIEAYADFYSFPWLRYRVNAPSSGADYFVQLNYRPNKQLEIYTRLRSETKSINFNPNDLTLSPVLPRPKQNWRTNLDYMVNPQVTLRSRAELVWFDKKAAQPEEGFLVFFDVLYKPLLRPFSASVRVQYFESDGYNSRLYAYENDVLYSYSIPVFYEKGYRYYINTNYEINRKLIVWIRAAQTIYKNKTFIGSGLDEIRGNKKTEVKLQLTYKF